MKHPASRLPKARGPRPGSIVRVEGLSYEHAAHKLLYLMNEARNRGLSGVLLKDEAEALPRAVSASGKNFLIGTD